MSLYTDYSPVPDETDGTAPLFAAMEEDKKKVGQLCRLLGESYYEKYKSAGGEFAPLLSSIRDTCARIEEAQAEIDRRRNILRCPGCHAEAPQVASFCMVCGCKLPNAQPAAPVVRTPCAGCGAMLPASQRFCTKCGAPNRPADETAAPAPAVAPPGVSAPAPATTAAPVPAPAPAQPSEPRDPFTLKDLPVQPPVPPLPKQSAENRSIDFCHKCGNVLHTDTVFCTVCGTKR